MTLYRWIREYIKKYSFILGTEFKNATLYIYYKKDGKIKEKHLPYRATKDQLIKAINKIKVEVNYQEDRKKRIAEGQYDVKEQDMAFAVVTSKMKNE